MVVFDDIMQPTQFGAMEKGSVQMVTCDDVLAAHERIRGAIHRTPVMTSRSVDALAGASLFLKMEPFQRAGAFKFRGAMNALSQFDADQRAGGVIAYSSGNHAQAIALAARELGIAAVIVMPEDAPAIKLAATRGYGAEVVLYDRYTEDREAIGQRIAAERGMTLIPPYDHDHIIAGQGTAAKELIDEVGPLDVLITPLGGGGLLAGSALAARAANPDCAVYGVEPVSGNDGQQSFRSGRIVTIETPRTIADGVQTLHLGERTFPIIRQHVTDVVTVEEGAIVDAMCLILSRMKVVAEPTGALPLAAVMTGAVQVTGKRVGLIVSGGNVDLARLAALLG